MTELTFRPSTADDTPLSSFDFTKLSAINSCPRWGIIRYSYHKEMPSNAEHRSMALEAGTVMHQCFSAVRLWQLGYVQGLYPLMHYHGIRLFGKDRWYAIEAAAHEQETAEQVRAMAMECLSTSGFADDVFDKRRTYANLETSLLYYCQRWEHGRYPVWVRDAGDPESDVGIEIPFSMTAVLDDEPLFRYTGRVDGIHVAADGSLMIQENKTASRLNTAWRMAFNTSHQVTGYMVAASLFTAQDIQRALVLGVSIPLPRTLSEGLAIEDVRRDVHAKAQWVNWLLHTVNLHNSYILRPLDAPMYTHSCNRYFSPCSMIPLCSADAQEQRVIMDEMVHKEWSPLHEAH